MARDRRRFVEEEGATAAAVPSPASLDDKALVATRTVAQHHEALRALVRAMARDAARADHAAKRGHTT